MLALLDETVFEVSAEIHDDFVNVRLECKDTAHRIILDDWTLHAGVGCLVCCAEEVVGELAVDIGAAVMVELGLGENFCVNSIYL